MPPLGTVADLAHKAEDAAAKVQPKHSPPQHHQPIRRDLTKAEKRATWKKRIRWIRDWKSCETACAHVAEKRRIPVEGILTALMAGILRFGIYDDAKAGALKFWALRSPDGRLCEGRRMNDQPWPNGEKAKKFWGSEGALIGQQLLSSEPDPVFLVEGSPDYLCACYLAWRADKRHWTPLAMLGAPNHFHQPLHQAALRKLAGRTLRIIADSDDSGAGRRAAERWASQSLGAGALAPIEVIYAGDVIEGAKDLNDIFAKGEPATVEDFVREVIR